MSTSSMESSDGHRTYLKYFAAGAFAGLVVDLSLFPLDTIKTRLQSQEGFWKSGGFRNIYSGLGSVAVGSAPNAALFFCTYETMKFMLLSKVPIMNDTCSQMIAASVAETAACVIRVPTEVIKQRTQTSRINSLENFRATIKSEGFRGLYRGFSTTLMREIPFAFIQYPLWESIKSWWSKYQKHKLNPLQSTICGAVAGGVAAFATTPLDVAKTRIMLAKKDSQVATGNVAYVLKSIWRESSFKGLFAGVVPRVTWISIGGALFLGSYDTFLNFVDNY